MISVLGNWIYMALTCFCLGYGFSKFVCKKLNYSISRLENVLFSGLIIVTVYAQFFSLLYKVELGANIVLLLICVGVVLVCRKEIRRDITDYFQQMSSVRKLVILGLVFIWSYFTSQGYIHYDTDLYHAQSIRWIEEYGVVKGLGNLHTRLAYNSSIFATTALYSMKFLVGQSLHTVCGFMALLLNVHLLDIANCFKTKKLAISDFVRIGAFYYLTLIYDEIVSPASDYIIMCTVFYIIIVWLEMLEKKEKKIVPYALLCVACVYAISLKLTAGLILILLIKPAYMLIKEKRVKEIFLYIIMGCIVILPWIIRNVLLSGYLVYPLPEIDFFSFAWKIDPVVAAKDAIEIKVWGRAVYDKLLIDMPIWEWFGNWFKTYLSGTEKIIVLADIGCILIGIGCMVYVFIRKKWEHLDWVLVEAMAIACYIFWQMSAPLIRYGYAYTLVLLMLTIGFLQQRIRLHKVVFWIVIIGGLVKLVMWAKVVGSNFYISNPVWQMDYGEYEVAEYKVNGQTFYYPVNGDQIGYKYFPAICYLKEFEFIGDEIKDGFYIAK